MSLQHKSVWLTLAVVMAAPVCAQPAQDSRPASAAASSTVIAPRTIIEGALTDLDKDFGSYRSYSEEELISWRKANDEFGRIGGWQAYAREAQEPTPETSDRSTTAPSQTPAAVPPPSSGGHDAHKQP